MSKGISFQPNLQLEPGVGPKVVTKRTLRETPNLWSYPLDEARELARGGLALALKRMERHPKFQEQAELANAGGTKPYVDSWYTKTGSGQVPSPYGLHVDGSHKKMGDHIPTRSLEHLGQNPDARLFLMSLSSEEGDADTLFITSPFSVEPSALSEKNTFADLHKAVFPRVQRGELDHIRLASGTLAIYDGNTVHTAMPTRIHRGTNLERCIVRVGFLPHNYPYGRKQKRHSEIPIYYPEI